MQVIREQLSGRANFPWEHSAGHENRLTRCAALLNAAVLPSLSRSPAGRSTALAIHKACMRAVREDE
jgi:hypothetical protein